MYTQRHVAGICSSHAHTRVLERRTRDDKREMQEQARMRRERDDRLMGLVTKAGGRAFGGVGGRGHHGRGWGV